MKIEDIIQLIMQQADVYAVDSYEDIIVGTQPVKRHKKKRIQKKWIKKYGIEPVYKKKKCKRIDVTSKMIIEFCYQHGYPLPDELGFLLRRDCDDSNDK